MLKRVIVSFTELEVGWAQVEMAHCKPERNELTGQTNLSYSAKDTITVPKHLAVVWYEEAGKWCYALIPKRRFA